LIEGIVRDVLGCRVIKYNSSAYFANSVRVIPCGDEKNGIVDSLRTAFVSASTPDPDDGVWSIGGMMTGVVKPKYSEKNLLRGHFTHHKPHTDCHGTEPVSPREKPATNHLRTAKHTVPIGPNNRTQR
jgi:hypothetical protein